MFEFELNFDLNEGPEPVDYSNDFIYDKEKFMVALAQSLPVNVCAKEKWGPERVVGAVFGFYIDEQKMILMVDGPNEEVLELMQEKAKLAPAWKKGPVEDPIKRIVEFYALHSGLPSFEWEFLENETENHEVDINNVKVEVAGQPVKGFKESKIFDGTVFDEAVDKMQANKETIENALKDVKLKNLQGVEVVGAIDLLSDMGERVVDELENARITQENVAFEIQKAADKVIEKLGVKVELPFGPDDLE